MPGYKENKSGSLGFFMVEVLESPTCWGVSFAKPEQVRESDYHHENSRDSQKQWVERVFPNCFGQCLRHLLHHTFSSAISTGLTALGRGVEQGPAHALPRAIGMDAERPDPVRGPQDARKDVPDDLIRLGYKAPAWVQANAGQQIFARAGRNIAVMARWRAYDVKASTSS